MFSIPSIFLIYPIYSIFLLYVITRSNRYSRFSRYFWFTRSFRFTRDSWFLSIFPSKIRLARFLFLIWYSSINSIFSIDWRIPIYSIFLIYMIFFHIFTWVLPAASSRRSASSSSSRERSPRVFSDRARLARSFSSSSSTSSVRP